MPKTCSPSCADIARSRAKVGTKNPAYKNGERAARIAWRATLEPRCRRCGRRAVHLHHVVYEQHVRREHGDAFDPANGLSLCRECHSGHHHAPDRRLKLSELRPENMKFAFDLLGRAAYDYFGRYYDVDIELTPD